MTELLALPIPTDGGFEVAQPQWWREPFSNLLWLPNKTLEGGFDTSAWSPAISNLIRAIKEGTREARERGSLRLALLNNMGALTVDQISAFAIAIWDRVDPTRGLPSDTGLRDNAILSLPDAEGRCARNIYRAYVLAVDFPMFSQRSTDADGKRTLTTHLNFGDNPLVADLLGATTPLFPTAEMVHKTIDWSSDEAGTLLRKAVAWWDNDKQGFQLNRETMFGDTIKRQFLMLLALLAEVILPRLARDAEEKALAERLLSEMEGSGLGTLVAVPMILFVDHDSYDEVSHRLRAGLNSTSEETVAQSIYGLYYWLAHSSKRSLLPPSDDLHDELINKVVYRRQPGLLYAIDRVSAILYEFPQVLNEKQIKSLCIGLEYLIADAALPDGRALEAATDLRSPIPVDEWPEYRRAAAKLALGLFNYYTRKDEVPAEIVINWKEACEKDVLPEVRRVWENDRLDDL